MRFILLLLLLISTLFSATPADIANALSIKGFDVTEVLATGSMKPTFDENYWLITEARPFDSLRVGDVIIFEGSTPYVTQDGVSHFLVCHRIVAISQPSRRYLVTMGDNNRVTDLKLVTEKDYRRVVIGQIRKDAVKELAER